MACAARVQIGPARPDLLGAAPARRGRARAARAHPPAAPPRRGRAARRSARAACPPGARSRSAASSSSSSSSEDAGIEALCPHGRSEVWTRKQAGIAGPRHARPRRRPGPRDRGARGDRRHGRLPRARDRVALERRRGRATSTGRRAGLEPRAAASTTRRAGSERAVWVDGVPARGGAGRASPPDLAAIRCEDGSSCCFTAEAERSRRDNLLILAQRLPRAVRHASPARCPAAIELARRPAA